jgi:HD-GYP domain-containing protein (c-di-GMP phosphodiesterase class II)
VTVKLERDLADCQGRILARRGQVVSAEAVAAVALSARPPPGAPLSRSVVAEDLRHPFAEPACRHLFRLRTVQATVEKIILSARLPEALHEELSALREHDMARYRHGLTTAAVATRMLLAAVGEAAALSDLAAAALLHDLGMRHVSPNLGHSGRRLEASEVREIAAHPLLGAWHLATVLGPHPAVEAALGHHWRQGRGYPRLPEPPPRSVEVIAVASAWSAMTASRHFRSAAYDARGATDVLIAEAQGGEADLEAVRLLVHALRGGVGEVRQVQFGRQRLGHAPEENRHTQVAHAVAG